MAMLNTFGLNPNIGLKEIAEHFKVLQEVIRLKNPMSAGND